MELINYIQLNDYFNPCIKTLKSNYILPNFQIGQVQILKTDKNNVFYWVTDWKDKMLQFVKLIRPVFRYKIPCLYYPMNIIYAIKPMVPYWMQHNDDLQLYIIKFSFKKTENLDIQYLNIYNEWSRCYRTVSNGEPCCLPY